MRRKKRRKTSGSKRIAKYAKAMRKTTTTFHERVTRYILRDICSSENITLKNQKIFYNVYKHKWYIVDFYIPELKLIIEIDGKSHLETVVYDDIRTTFLESIGNKVVRFWNDEVEERHFREKLLSSVKLRASALPGSTPSTVN